MKDLKINLKMGKASDWQKGLFLALLSSLVIFFLGVIFIFFKPATPSVKEIIDEETASTDISFDKKILEMLRTRQNPTLNTPSSAGKNPFAPF